MDSLQLSDASGLRGQAVHYVLGVSQQVFHTRADGGWETARCEGVKSYVCCVDIRKTILT
jgi:hypothetical protein